MNEKYIQYLDKVIDLAGIGPFFINSKLNGNYYLAKLQDLANQRKLMSSAVLTSYSQIGE